MESPEKEVKVKNKDVKKVKVKVKNVCVTRSDILYFKKISNYKKIDFSIIYFLKNPTILS
jgi:hypothetical protein